MEDGNGENTRRKRLRDESEPDSPELKRFRVDSEINSFEFDSDEPGLNSPESIRIREDILDILEDPESGTDREPPIQDLDSVMKSFEEEILHPSAAPPPEHFDLTAPDSAEFQPDLGYLLGASDDELGLPPVVSPSEEEQKNEVASSTAVSFEAAVLVDALGIEGQLPSYDSLDFGIGESTHANGDNGDGEFVTLGGLFDNSEESALSEFSWQPESLPAL